MHCSSWGVPALDAMSRPLLVAPPGWRGLPVDVFTIPALETRGPYHFAQPTIQLALSGEGRRVHRRGTRQRSLCTVPEMIELYGRDYDVDGASWEGAAGRCISVRLADEVTGRLAELSHLDLQTRHEVFDPRLAQLIQSLAEEAQAGACNGPLFAEGLSLALVGYLLQHYGAPIQENARRSRGLSAQQRRQVIDCIHANLNADLSIAQLAALLGMSASQFNRCFRASFGVTPYQYVLRSRVAAAARVLKEDIGLPIAQVALMHGFASQAHFTETFRRLTGRTPAAARFS